MRGIDNIPNRYDLYFSLAWLYKEKYKDDCQAEYFFEKAAAFKDAPGYIARMLARAQERCGDVRGAYKYWIQLWSQDHATVKQDWHIIEREIKRLEDVLHIPNSDRYFNRHPVTAPSSS
jgi:hypothetical protein